MSLLIPSLWGRIDKSLVPLRYSFGLHPLGEIRFLFKALLYKAFLFISGF